MKITIKQLKNIIRESLITEISPPHLAAGGIAAYVLLSFIFKKVYRISRGDWAHTDRNIESLQNLSIELFNEREIIKTKQMFEDLYEFGKRCNDNYLIEQLEIFSLIGEDLANFINTDFDAGDVTEEAASEAIRVGLTDTVSSMLGVKYFNLVPFITALFVGKEILEVELLIQRLKTRGLDRISDELHGFREIHSQIQANPNRC
jgi:hypothetical protein